MQENEIPEDISLNSILKLIIQGRKTMIYSVVSLMFLGLIYGFSQDDIYKSEILLAETEFQNVGGSSGMGMSSLLGLTGLEENKSLDLAKEIFKSRDFYRYFTTKREIFPYLLAAGSYDKKTKILSLDEDVYNFETKQWLINEPDLNDPELKALFSSHFVFSADSNPGFVVISAEHKSPQIAKSFVDWIVQDLNIFMSLKEREKSTMSKDFLENKLRTTKEVELREQISLMIAKELNTLMLSERADQFAFNIVDNSFLPSVKSYPSRLIILIISTFVGFILGLCILLTNHYFSNDKRN